MGYELWISEITGTKYEIIILRIIHNAAISIKYIFLLFRHYYTRLLVRTKSDYAEGVSGNARTSK